jgi:hypothetical protein
LTTGAAEFSIGISWYEMPRGRAGNASNRFKSNKDGMSKKKYKQFFGSTFLVAISVMATAPHAQTCSTSSQPKLSVRVAGAGTVTTSPAGIACASGTCENTFSLNSGIVLSATPSAGAAFVGWGGNCQGIASTTSVLLSASTTCTAVFEAAGSYRTLYVATTGNDTSGDGSEARPWQTIRAGISKMLSGETLVVKAGTYSGLINFINGIPSGTALRATRVVAERPMEVRIQSTTPLNYFDTQLQINGNYINVDGFIFDMAATNDPPNIADIEGNFNKVTRSIFKRSGDIDAYGGLLFNGGNDNLFEDLAGVGACRYCFVQGGPTASTQRNIWRRIVGRFDYSNSLQPKATFATYGNDSNLSVRDHLYQNVIAIDGQNPGTLGGTQEKYGAFYTPKNTANVRLQGSMVLKEGVGNAGIFIREFNSVNSASHTVIWDLPASSNFAIGLLSASGANLTIGGTIPGAATELAAPATASLLKPAALPATLVNNTPGAVILKRYGGTGTRWGEPGFDVLSNEDLWPWPFQEKIKSVFAEANPVPAGNSPATNNTKRGFAADGTGIYGGPITLTSYIWEYLGTICPRAMCP